MARPTAAAALAIDERLLDLATASFLSMGYEASSIEAMVQAGQMSKRTLYSRYPNKTALFHAVVERIVSRLRPPSNVPLIAGSTPAARLRHLGRLILEAGLNPDALALHRLLTREGSRFPDLLAAIDASGGTREVAQLVLQILDEAGTPPGADASIRHFASQRFLWQVLGEPRQAALTRGMVMSAAEQQRWVDQVVELFLRGCVHPGSQGRVDEPVNRGFSGVLEPGIPV